MAGNANSGRRQEKPFADALRMELAAIGEDHQALRMIARKVIESAQAGKMDAITFLADRTDGKVPMAVDASHTHEVGDTLTAFMRDMWNTGAASIMPPLNDGD